MVDSRHTCGSPPFGVLLALVSKLGGAEPGPFLYPSTTDYVLKTFYSVQDTLIKHVCQVFLRVFCYTPFVPKPRKSELPSMNWNSTIVGERISAFRKKHGLTQRELAEQIGIKQTLISDYETSRSRLSDEMIVRLSQALGCSADDLLGLKRTADSELDDPIDLRFMKRAKQMKDLTPAAQQRILQTLDALIRDAKQQVAIISKLEHEDTPVKRE